MLNESWCCPLVLSATISKRFLNWISFTRSSPDRTALPIIIARPVLTITLNFLGCCIQFSRRRHDRQPGHQQKGSNSCGSGHRRTACCLSTGSERLPCHSSGAEAASRRFAADRAHKIRHRGGGGQFSPRIAAGPATL